jgi:hypothetical protein
VLLTGQKSAVGGKPPASYRAAITQWRPWPRAADRRSAALRYTDGSAPRTAAITAQQGNVERTESVSEERAECQRWPTLDAESLPSNYLFIAYGLTSLPIAFLLIPFFVGRLVSYTFWVRTASTVVDWLDVDVDWFGSRPISLPTIFPLSCC